MTYDKNTALTGAASVIDTVKAIQDIVPDETAAAVDLRQACISVLECLEDPIAAHAISILAASILNRRVRKSHYLLTVRTQDDINLGVQTDEMTRELIAQAVNAL